MIRSIKFNTEEKAKKCRNMLGNRGLFTMSIVYKGVESGYWVYYINK